MLGSGSGGGRGITRSSSTWGRSFSHLSSSVPSPGSLCSGRRALTLHGAVDTSARHLGVDPGDLTETLATLGAALDEPLSLGGGAVRALWDAALGTAVPAPAAVSHEWGFLGFQGHDPRSDLRSGSSNAALRLAVRALHISAPLRAEALRGALGAGPPFALSVFNVIHVLAAHLHLLTPKGDRPPAFCPCCGAAIRKGEYELRAAQSHAGAALTGFVALVAEEMRVSALEPLTYNAADAGFASGVAATASLPALLPGEAVLVLLLETTILRLGTAWRAAGRGEGAVNRATLEELNVSVREALARGEHAGMGDSRQLSFPRFLAEVRGELMGALAGVASVSYANNSGSSGSASRGKRSAPDESLWGNVSTSLLDFRTSNYRSGGAVEITSPLESARAAGGADADNDTRNTATMTTPLRMALRREMRIS